MNNIQTQVTRSSSTSSEGKDLHLILTYRHEVEQKTVESDILKLLSRIRTITKDNFEYCYTIRPITDKRPAIHILLRPKKKLNEKELLSFWDKGIAKASVVTPADKRAMDYYLSRWNSKISC